MVESNQNNISNTPQKKKGFFKRLFGGKEVQPSTQTPNNTNPLVDVQPINSIPQNNTQNYSKEQLDLLQQMINNMSSQNNSTQQPPIVEAKKEEEKKDKKPNKTKKVEEEKKVDEVKNDEITKESVKENLTKLHSKIDIETIKKIDSEKDVGKKKKDQLVKKIYPYWVYIVKDGEPIKNFGVREETINGIKLLIRTEKVNDELRVVFRELYPEPKYDLNIIESNKKRLSQELNQLKQIEKELESELFEKGERSEYNYDLSDVKIAILEKEVLLDSIKYGKSFRYVQKWVRDDGIPALVYEFENNGLRLKKEVKEKSLFTEASEVKQIESLESKRDIDESLKKSDGRDWKKIAYAFLWAFILLIATYGVFELLNYNQERANGELIAQVQRMEVSCSNTYNNIKDSLVNANKPFLDAITQNNNVNNEIIQRCIESNLIEGTTQKPTITE